MKKKIIIVRTVYFAVTFIVFGVILYYLSNCGTSNKNISFEEFYNNGNITIMGVDKNTTKTEFEHMMGMSYSEYLTLMDNAEINNQLEPYIFLFNDIPAICLMRFEDEALRNIILYFPIEDAFSATDWIYITDSLTQKLQSVSSDTTYWRYTLPNAIISLELVSVGDKEQILGSRVSEMWITFTE